MTQELNTLAIETENELRTVLREYHRENLALKEYYQMKNQLLETFADALAAEYFPASTPKEVTEKTFSEALKAKGGFGISVLVSHYRAQAQERALAPA